MNLSSTTMNRCRRPQSHVVATATAVAAAAAVNGMAVSSFLSLSPTFTSRRSPTLFPPRVPSSMDGTVVIGEDGPSRRRSRRRPLNFSRVSSKGNLPLASCHWPSTVLCMNASVEPNHVECREVKLTALKRGALLRERSASGLPGSVSGQYGGLSGCSDRSRRTASSLSVSRSGNVLGFRVEDFEPYEPDNKGNIGGLKFTQEDFCNYLEESFEVQDKGPVISRLNARSANPTSNYIAASLLKNTAKNRRVQVKRGSQSSSLSKPNSKQKERSTPLLPWVLTESQINSLKVAALRAECDKRGIATTGKKTELQHRLLIWATVQDRKRVKDRLRRLKSLLELTSKEAEAAKATKEVEEIVKEYDVESYNVDELTSKRKAFHSRPGKVDKNRGILGLVDESYFDTTSTTAESDYDKTYDDEEKEEEVDESDEPDEDNSMVNSASLSRLAETFRAPSSNFSNHEVREIYIQAKIADQNGDRSRSKGLLSQLRIATPHDMRVLRRLARMEMEEGNLSKARCILADGLQKEPDNAHLLHGLGQLERKAGNDYTAKKYFRTSCEKDPTFANPYHALGTLEHSHGNIRMALTVIKKGLKHCPKNHRLFHALGDVYLDANMLDLAEESYLEGLRHGPPWSKCFAYTSLSFVSYARGQRGDARLLLRKSLRVNGGMHAQGVIALAQLEESEGNIQEARKVYRNAVSKYEKRRRERNPFYHRSNEPAEDNNILDLNKQGNRQTWSFSGDKWINVFHSWARMEQIHGTYETAHIVFGKAARLFPDNINLLIKWAELQVANHHDDSKKARQLYRAACHLVGGMSSEPYWKFATFEMKRKNFHKAQDILLRGAHALGEELSSPPNGSSDLAHLFHTWGVCAYHLGRYSRAEELFDNALRVTGSEDGDFSTMRSLILYSMARLEFARGEYLLAQHCIGLSLKENLLPGGNSLMWKLWYKIADKMENTHLATRCKEQALLRRKEEKGSGTMFSDLSRLLGNRELPQRTGSAIKDMFRKTPWYSKVCPPSGRIDKTWYSGAMLWEV